MPEPTNYVALIKESGLNMSHIARLMNMGESHLRYFLENPETKKGKKVVALFLKTVRKASENLLKKLP